MSWLAYGAHVPAEHVDRRGIRDLRLPDLAYTGQLGYSVKLVAHSERRERPAAVHLRVRPTAVPSGHALFDVNDSANAVLISSDLAKSIAISGIGAGGPSTASAVVADIVAAVRRRGHQPGPPPQMAAQAVSDEDIDIAGYVRIRLDGSADARAIALQALEDRGVPVVDAIDKPPLDGPLPQLVILTGLAPRAVHDRALETLDTLAVVRDIACSLDRIETSA
jgi:homoserine dehydrogenase